MGLTELIYSSAPNPFDGSLTRTDSCWIHRHCALDFWHLTSQFWRLLNVYFCHNLPFFFFFVIWFCIFLSFMFCAVMVVVILLSYLSCGFAFCCSILVVFSSDAGGWTRSRPGKSKNVILPAREPFFAFRRLGVFFACFCTFPRLGVHFSRMFLHPKLKWQ